MSAPPFVPELLAPAGDWDAMRTAVANGADAVYFGLSAFNARHRAANFSLDELPDVMAYLHAHNVRGYVTLNVLIFSDELRDADRFIEAVGAAGVDAIIVQDLGLVELARQTCPTLPIHGSTQMTLTEPLGVEFVRRLGVGRAILARELSLNEIGKISSQSPMPLEIFVHGALCVSYSGQCLTSESLGGRSANRGQCAQACRLPYDLIVDQTARDLGDKSYLLSPQDLAAHDLIDDIARLGISCVKIEGRLKSAHYVAATTQTYRDAIDAAAEGHRFTPTVQQKQDLAQSFSRGFTHGFLSGVNHQELVHARFPKSRGLRAGEVIGRSVDRITVRLLAGCSLKPGDGIVLDEGHPDQDEQGGRISEVLPVGREKSLVEVAFFRGDLNLSAVAVGSIVWKTDDPEMRKRLEHSYSRDVVARRVPLDVDIIADIGKPLTLRVATSEGDKAEVTWDRPLERAQKHPISHETFHEQFGRLGETPFELREIRANGSEDAEFPPVMIPKSVLNDLRRQAVALLLERRMARGRHDVANADALDRVRGEINIIAKAPQPLPGAANDQCQLNVLVRSMDQLHEVIDWQGPPAGAGRGLIYCEFEDVRKYPEAVKLANSAGIPVALATVRIVKPPEHGLLKQVAEAGPDAILIRNLAGLAYFSEHYPQIPLIADYSLNIANELTAAILARHGVRRITPSYDLNWKQMAAMSEKFPVAWFEAVIHQHMPMFHMEHCVFAHVLSEGKDFHDCGRPCEKHVVSLRDRTQVDHALVADVGCRNTVYNGIAQSGAEYVPRMKEMGIRQFRLELLREDRASARNLLERFGRVLAGVDDGRQTLRDLRVLNQLGVARGTLE
jgi:U32 family peptidase